MPLTLILHDSEVTRLHTQSPRLLCLLWPSTCAQIRCTLRYLVNFIRVTSIDVIYTIVTQKTQSCNVYLKLGKPNSLFYIILFSQSIVLYFSSYFTLCKRVSGPDSKFSSHAEWPNLPLTTPFKLPFPVMLPPTPKESLQKKKKDIIPASP